MVGFFRRAAYSRRDSSETPIRRGRINRSGNRTQDVTMSANGVSPVSVPAADPRQMPLPGARAALVLLLAINLFNYIDRQVLAAVEPEIEEHLFPGGGENAEF